MVFRALTVLGGAAAGTALAWWLSSTSASAQTDVPVDAPALVQQIVVPVEQPAVEHTVDVAARQLRNTPAPPAEQVGDLGQKVTDAAERFQSRADLPELPRCADLCQRDELRVYPVDGFDRTELPGTPALAPAPAPVATTVAPGVAVDALTPNTAKDRASADGMSRRGSPAPARPVDPGLPNWPAPLPFTPTGIPTTGNHGSAGNDGDSHLFTALPGQDRADGGLVVGGVADATDAATTGRVSARPGVVPD
jgi:hypothetical protein